MDCSRLKINYKATLQNDFVGEEKNLLEQDTQFFSLKKMQTQAFRG
jgi:hypothetical protein